MAGHAKPKTVGRGLSPRTTNTFGASGVVAGSIGNGIGNIAKRVCFVSQDLIATCPTG